MQISRTIAMRPVTEREILRVHANARELDKLELAYAQDYADAHGVAATHLTADATAWLFYRDDAAAPRYTANERIATTDLIGYGGFSLTAPGSVLSHERYFFFISTRTVDTMRKSFYASTPAAFRAMAAHLPTWVDTAIAAPIVEYKASIAWLERALGFTKQYHVIDNSHEYIIMQKRRKRPCAIQSVEQY